MLLTLRLLMYLSFCLCFKSFIVYCHINSDDDHRQLVGHYIFFFDILLIKLKYVSQNTLYVLHICCNTIYHNDENIVYRNEKAPNLK